MWHWLFSPGFFRYWWDFGLIRHLILQCDLELMFCHIVTFHREYIALFTGETSQKNHTWSVYLEA